MPRDKSACPTFHLRTRSRADLNKSPGQSVARIVNGVPVDAAGAPVATTNVADAFHVRMRVQRDF